MRSDLRGEEGARRYQTTPTKPQKPSTSVGSDPAFLSQSEQEIESVHWKLSWHFPPLLLPLSSWVRLPRELLWWLIDFNHITRLQKSRQRMKVLGNTTPWNPHTHTSQYLFVQRCIRYLALKGALLASLKLHVCPIVGRNSKTNRDTSGRSAHWFAKGHDRLRSSWKWTENHAFVWKWYLAYYVTSRFDIVSQKGKSQVWKPRCTSPF